MFNFDDHHCYNSCENALKDIKFNGTFNRSIKKIFFSIKSAVDTKFHLILRKENTSSKLLMFLSEVSVFKTLKKI